MGIGEKGGSTEGPLTEKMKIGMALVLAGPEVALAGEKLDAQHVHFGLDGPEGGPLTLATTTGQLILPSLDRAVLAARVAADNKGRDIIVLDMRGITPLYDYFIVATGASRRLVHTITEEIDAALRDQGDRRLSVEGYDSSTWIVQDYGDLMIHVFNPQTREYYGIEELWADAPRVDWESHEIAGV